MENSPFFFHHKGTDQKISSGDEDYDPDSQSEKRDDLILKYITDDAEYDQDKTGQNAEPLYDIHSYCASLRRAV